MFAVGLVSPKCNHNVGSALRAAGCFGARMVAYTGNRYKGDGTDTRNEWRNVPLLRVEDMRSAIPYKCIPVAVEICNRAQSLVDYMHPTNAFYVFGPEDGSLGKNVLGWCRDVVYVPTNYCMNLAATVNVVLYDRMVKHGCRTCKSTECKCWSASSDKHQLIVPDAAENILTCPSLSSVLDSIKST
jgi:tRNA(Leu) C34 or U34 (ribose-2'-O)-methylase TrmL